MFGAFDWIKKVYLAATVMLSRFRLVDFLPGPCLCHELFTVMKSALPTGGSGDFLTELFFRYLLNTPFLQLKKTELLRFKS